MPGCGAPGVWAWLPPRARRAVALARRGLGPAGVRGQQHHGDHAPSGPETRRRYHQPVIVIVMGMAITIGVAGQVAAGQPAVGCGQDGGHNY